ncbi:hypothetical protein Glove_505g35 [Diversispora epigaea]|uniref:Uncharacterized protein n=1 Tax=Diversispora epigaea TaxID=1348612 RepID=A0A397GIW0_9GLOM|nr:hypothetical protein Glove_505g35 [Diversispora epigaea]
MFASLPANDYGRPDGYASTLTTPLLAFTIYITISLRLRLWEIHAKTDRYNKDFYVLYMKVQICDLLILDAFYQKNILVQWVKYFDDNDIASSVFMKHEMKVQKATKLLANKASTSSTFYGREDVNRCHTKGTNCLLEKSTVCKSSECLFECMACCNTDQTPSQDEL